MIFFATAAKGTEGAIRDELRSLRFRGVRATRGGVSFEGPLEEGYRACLYSRTAVRILLELGTFPAPDGDALYEGVAGFDWAQYLDERTTLAVRASLRSSKLTHSQFVSQRTKDAIVDQLRDKLGGRPNVDREDPDFGVFVHLVKDEATIYADLGGRPLHLRAYRKVAGEAPLKETLAACLVWLSGWDKQGPLSDPMCGSGTIAIEADAIARHVAPGVLADPFGFSRWLTFDGEAKRQWQRAVQRARDEELREGPPISGSDSDEEVLGMARENARRAGAKVSFDQRHISELSQEVEGTLITNPPYGERIEMSAPDKITMGRLFSRLKNADLGLLAGAPSLLEAVRRRPDKLIAVMNGDIECRFALFQRSKGKP